MSATRILRKLDTSFRFMGGWSVTVGLSSVGPPPTFMISQLLATWMMVGSPLRTTVPPRDAHIERCRAVDIGDGEKVGHDKAFCGRQGIRCAVTHDGLLLLPVFLQAMPLLVRVQSTAGRA